LPGVEVLAVELSAPDRFTVFVDHAEGVDHALCARVTDALRGYLGEYAVEVSSPGIERPLRRPEHFRNAVGRTVTLRYDPRDLSSVLVFVDGARMQRAAPQPHGRAAPGLRSRAGRAGEEMSQEIIEHPWPRGRRHRGEHVVGALGGFAPEDSWQNPAPPSARRRGEFRVFSIEIPGDLEAQLLDEAMKQIGELERLEETGRSGR
jgi:hypothetical protein